MMRLERARRMLEAKDGDEFRKNCGDLPLRLQQAVEALEALVPTGTKLYQARSDHSAKQQWEHKPNRAPAGGATKPKETRNAARRRRNKKQALEKAGGAPPTAPITTEPASAPPADPPDEEDSGDSHASSDRTDLS